ncbi:MAG: MTH1187 family thiamine-binding protein [Thermodesulfobacteriota bacterium]
MAIMQIIVMPRVPEGISISPYVAEIHKYLQAQKLPHQLHDMGTLVEGKTSALLTLAKRLHEIPFRKGVQRVYTIIHIDDRRDKKVSLGDKVKSVRQKMKKG